MPNETIPGTKNVAARVALAEENFISVLMTMGDIPRTDAERVFAYYRKNKLVKRDAVNARFDVKHGAFLDRDVIRRAAAQ